MDSWILKIQYFNQLQLLFDAQIVTTLVSGDPFKLGPMFL